MEARRYAHAPVMVQEVVEALRPQAGQRYLDGTLGGGGHAEQILERSGPDGQVLGLDWDEEAIRAAHQRLERFGGRLITRRANFTTAGEILKEMGWDRVNGILLDLGLSSHQVESAVRGFSFQTEGRLDMRMDRRQSLDAYQIVNSSSVSELERIFMEYGEEPMARQVARAIDAQRREQAIQTTQELVRVVTSVTRGRGRPFPRPGTHAATRVFQALRVAVNWELENLEVFLKSAYEWLVAQGRMAVISFHSLEDRRVKQAFKKWSQRCLCPRRTPVCRCGWSQKVGLLTPKPLRPSLQEVRRNPRARSARLRAVERL